MQPANLRDREDFSLSWRFDLPWHQRVARERGILDVRYRRNYAATETVHLDAMTEFHVLAENG
jgi:hypothetical protein